MDGSKNSPQRRTLSEPGSCDQAPAKTIEKVEFSSRLKAEIVAARLQNIPVSLLVLDIDHFKSINDAFGHARGDQILTEFTQRLTRIARSADIVVRFGGDEFVLILPDTAKHQSLLLANRLLEMMRSTQFEGDPPLNISISAGVATWPDEAEDGDALFERADAYLYEAKRRGRGQVTGDGEQRPLSSALQPLSRLVERDVGLEALYAFYRGLPADGTGIFTIHGPQGAGRSRFLTQAEQAARVLGYEVLSVRCTAALQRRMYGALIEGRPEWESRIWSGAPAIWEMLREGCGTGLLIAIDDLPWLDSESLVFLRELLGCATDRRVALAYTSQASDPPAELGAAASLSAGVSIAPLTPAGLRTWLRAALRWEPPAGFVSWLHQETGGLPARIQVALGRIVELDVLSRHEHGWELDARFEQHSLGAWLESRADTSTLQIPSALSTIVGRDAEIREVKERIRHDRLLTLIGPGGFGKTRLAMQVKAELGDEFADGAWFVSLVTVEAPDQVAKAVAQTLRCSLNSGSDQVAQIVDFLRGKQMLLVMDNFEHVIPAAPLLTELLDAAPGLRVLATSREGLNLRGEALFPIRGMALPASDRLEDIRRSTAVRLFLQQARRQRPEFSIEAEDGSLIAGICRQLDGIPLAIELAAALVRVLSCAEILSEIERDLDCLVSTAQDRPERHRSLHTVFDYSWNLLAAGERALWIRLSIFRGGFRRETAVEVAGASLPVLMTLLNKSLIARTAEGRFEIHEALRRYAHDKLAEEPAELARVEMLRSRHFANFVFTRGERGRSEAVRKAVAEIAEEVENVRAGFQWALEHGASEDIERYAKGLFRYYDLSGGYVEGKELFAEAASRVEDDRLLGLLRGRQGYFCFQLGEHERARVLHRQSIRLLRGSDSFDEASLSLYSLGSIAYQQGKYDIAARLYRKCIRIHRRTDSQFGVALCLNDLGIVALLQGRLPEAKRHFRRSLAIRRKHDDPAGVARCLNNLGMIADQEGRGATARRCFERSLAAAREAEDRRMVANTLNNLGVFAHRAGEEEGSPQLLKEARGFLQEALEVYTEINSKAGATLALYNLGDIARLLGMHEEAEAQLLEALRRASEMRETPRVISVLVGIAKLLIRTGDLTLAAELLVASTREPAAIDEDRRSAEQLLDELGDRLDAGLVQRYRDGAAVRSLHELTLKLSHGILSPPDEGGETPAASVPLSPTAAASDLDGMIREGQAAERHGRSAAARAYYEAALSGLRDACDAPRAPALIRWIARTYITESQFAAAEDCLESSRASAEAHGDLSGVAHAINLQGIIYFSCGQVDEAAQQYLLARGVAGEAADARLVAMIDQNLGVIANIKGDLEAALKHYQACLDGFRALEADENIPEALNNLGMLYTDQQSWAEADAAFAEALQICERIGNTQGRVMIDVNRVELGIARRAFDSARAVCDSAFEQASRLGDARALGELHKHYGVIFRETNQFHLSEAHFRHAEVSASDRGDLLLAAETAREQAELFWQMQRNPETLQYLNRAHGFFIQLRARRDLAAMHGRIEAFENLFLETVQRWSASIESADRYTQGHCERVATLACGLARAAGLSEETMFWFRMGALLHDLGKIVVPSEILNKPGQLTPDERAVIERHPDAGVSLLEGVEFPWDIRPMVRFHHERWDGHGYPTGISGEEIPIAARILCIADVYDALTSDRAYRPGFSHEKAMDIMENGMRGHFDPKLFALFVEFAVAETVSRPDADEQPPETRGRHLRVMRVA